MTPIAFDIFPYFAMIHQNVRFSIIISWEESYDVKLRDPIS